jgi:hypothetical protein
MTEIRERTVLAAKDCGESQNFFGDSNLKSQAVNSAKSLVQRWRSAFYINRCDIAVDEANETR